MHTCTIARALTRTLTGIQEPMKFLDVIGLAQLGRDGLKDVSQTS